MNQGLSGSNLDGVAVRGRGASLRVVVVVAALVMALLPPPVGVAAPGDVVWTRQFGTGGMDVIEGAAVSADGAVYVAGSVRDALPDETYQGEEDAFVRKYDAAGTHIWTRQFGTSGRDEALAIAVATDGSVYVGGFVSGALPGQTHTGGHDAFVRKYDSAGTHVWTRQFSGSGSTYVRGVAVGHDGSLYVAGSVGGNLPGQSTAGSQDAYVRKYDPAGNVLWTRQFGTDEWDEAYDVAVTPADDVVVVGFVEGTLDGQTSSDGDSDAFVRVYNAFGTSQWTHQFGTSVSAAAFGVAADSDGRVIVVGSVGGALPGQTHLGGSDAFVRVYEPSGVEVWTDQFGGGSHDLAMSVASTVGGGLVVSGRSASDSFVREYGADGALLWGDMLGVNSQGAHAVAAGPDGSVFQAGSVYEALPGQIHLGNGDAFVRKYEGAVPPQDPAEVVRLAGANRFETAAAVAAHHHALGVGSVFVATGHNFPDALTGAAAAGLVGAPLLLTGSVPPATASALEALDPDDIRILGGEAAVSAADAVALGEFGSVERIFGANRYETAVEVSRWAYPVAGSADVVVIATGENFPDALAAAAVATALGGPVLLTPPTSLHPATAAEIERLDPGLIIVAGGAAAVSTAVFDALDALHPTSRVAGDDRYGTAVALSKRGFEDPETVDAVYVAVGTNFPDALAGAAAAAALGAPVLLTPSGSLPQVVADEILRLSPTRIYILGGTAVVSEAVEAQLEALLGL